MYDLLEYGVALSLTKQHLYHDNKQCSKIVDISWCTATVQGKKDKKLKNKHRHGLIATYVPLKFQSSSLYTFWEKFFF